MKSLSSIVFVLIGAILLLTPGKGYGQDFVYTPKDPAFGGSPLNYSWLLSSANAQNKFQGSTDFGFNQNPLADFQQSLQRQVLSQLTQNVIQKRFGNNIDLTKESNFEFGEFSIDIIPGPDGIDINITDNSTGKQTTVTVPNL